MNPQQFNAIAQNPVILEIDVATALALIGNIQLALRHPQNVGSSATLVRDTAIKLSKELIKRYPEVAIVIEAGWSEENMHKAIKDLLKP